MKVVDILSEGTKDRFKIVSTGKLDIDDYYGYVIKHDVANDEYHIDYFIGKNKIDQKNPDTYFDVSDAERDAIRRLKRIYVVDYGKHSANMALDQVGNKISSESDQNVIDTSRENIRDTLNELGVDYSRLEDYAFDEFDRVINKHIPDYEYGKFFDR